MAGTEALADGPWRYEKLTDASRGMRLDKAAESNGYLVVLRTD